MGMAKLHCCYDTDKIISSLLSNLLDDAVAAAEKYNGNLSGSQETGALPQPFYKNNKNRRPYVMIEA